MSIPIRLSYILGLYFLVASQLLGEVSKPQRVTLSLDGQWEVDDSVGADEKPSKFAHTVPVPGLTHSATPLFADVDQYQTRQLLSNLVRQGSFSSADYDRSGNTRGISHQKRNYFWYRRNFQAPARNAVALLRVNKAQFGTMVYLNGVKIGEHDGCFTAAYFDVSQAIHWNTSNEIVIRIGAHPGVLPETVSGGTDFEKNRWTPGIYDEVSLLVMSNPVIATVQVAPRLSESAALVETEVHNYSDHPVETTVAQRVFEFKSGLSGSHLVQTHLSLAAGESRKVQQVVPIPHVHVWSPEDPFLYQLRSATGGDDVKTRFGMREFRFDTTTQRAYLNGRPYFMRGSNITLHRFFEDPEVGTLPWDEAWLHRLLVEIPKQLHWNTFRFCIGPVPDRWLEIADEHGLLIQNEYMVWTGHPSWSSWQASYDNRQMISEYKEWMRDNWNHPSVAIWDATNESWLPEFTNTIVPAVRSLDLSNRPWENSYNAPVGPDDPVEDHQYLLVNTAMQPSVSKDGTRPIPLSELESMMGPAPNSPTIKTGHALILNEYGWVWLNRDGTPTLLTDRLYPNLLGDRNNTENRFALQAYLLGGETEYWRAYRRYAGVLHFVYLTASDPKAFTSDHFQNLRNLTLEPHFAKAMEQAFNPLGVYLNFWQPSLHLSDLHDYTVAMVNDEDRPRSGKLRLVFVDGDGKEAQEAEVPFKLARLGAQSYVLSLKAPSTAGKYSLQAIASPEDDALHPITSSRDVAIQQETSQR